MPNTAINRSKSKSHRLARSRFRHLMIEQLDRRYLMAFDVLEDTTKIINDWDFEYNYGGIQSLSIRNTSSLAGQLKLNGQPLPPSYGPNGTNIDLSLLRDRKLTFTPTPGVPNGSGTYATSFQYFISGITFPSGLRDFNINIIGVNDKPFTRDVLLSIQEDSTVSIDQNDIFFDDGDSSYSGMGYPIGVLNSVIIRGLPDSRFGELTFNNQLATVGLEIPAANLSMLRFRHVDYIVPLTPTNGNTNRRHPMDVNNDGTANVSDYFQLVNRINAGPTYEVAGFYDVNGDGNVDPFDVLEVINWTNSYGNGFTGFRFAVRDTQGTLNNGVDVSDTKFFGFTVIPANDPPVGTGTNPQVVQEDSSYVFTSSVFGYTDPMDFPPNPFGGVKITSLPSSGKLWLLTATPREILLNELLSVNNTQYLRFIPNPDFNGSCNFTFRVFDNTYSMVPGGGSVGYPGAPALGIDTVDRTFTINVLPVNDPPVLATPSVQSLPNTAEDSISVTRTVPQILTQGGYADIDGPLQGIAVTSVSGPGNWEYSIDGLSWIVISSTVSDASSLLLSSQTQLRFKPSANQFGSASFQFRAWDTSAGIASTATPSFASNTDLGGGTSTSSVSATSGTVFLTVLPVNDAPTLSILSQ
jgi:hypothetical protein